MTCWFTHWLFGEHFVEVALETTSEVSQPLSELLVVLLQEDHLPTKLHKLSKSACLLLKLLVAFLQVTLQHNDSLVQLSTLKICILELCRGQLNSPGQRTNLQAQLLTVVFRFLPRCVNLPALVLGSLNILLHLLNGKVFLLAMLDLRVQPLLCHCYLVLHRHYLALQCFHLSSKKSTVIFPFL